MHDRVRLLGGYRAADLVDSGAMKRIRDAWNTRKHGPLTRDRCETCGQRLRVKQRVEVTEVDPPGMTEFGFGGGGMTATYCKNDAPLEAA